MLVARASPLLDGSNKMSDARAHAFRVSAYKLEDAVSFFPALFFLLFLPLLFFF